MLRPGAQEAMTQVSSLIPTIQQDETEIPASRRADWMRAGLAGRHARNQQGIPVARRADRYARRLAGHLPLGGRAAAREINTFYQRSVRQERSRSGAAGIIS